MLQIWFILIGLVASTCCDSLNHVKTYRTGQEFTNLEYYNGKLFIGSQDKIHVFNELLDLPYNISTCEGKDVKCNNSNKVLVVNNNYQQLIFCGTGNNRICEARNMSNLNETHTSSSNSSTEEHYLQVSSESRRPALGVITQTNDFLIAITYGMGMGPYSDSYKYPLSARKTEHKEDRFKTFQNGGTTSFLILSVKTVPQPSNDYIIYYRGKFQNNGSSYFVTNQKEYVKATKFVSKIVQICGNVSNYVDLVTTCTNNNENYNLVQDAVLINVSNTAETYVVFTFAKGTDVETPDNVSAICMAKLSEINQNLLKAKKTFALFCDEEAERGEEDQRYLKNNKLSGTYTCANNQTIGGITQSFEICEYLQLYTNVIGKEAMPLTFVKGFSSELITTLYASTLNGNNILLAGTSGGTVIMMNVQANKVAVYHTLQLPTTKPVKAIYMKNEDDHIYVMTSYEVFRYNHSDCDEYKTCSEVVKGQNPMCGWCIFRNRSTRASRCPIIDWIPALSGKCVSISPNPANVEVRQGMSGQVEISTENLRNINSSYSYECRFEKDSFSYTAKATINNAKFNCSIPTVSDHKDAILRLFVNTGTSYIELASHPFLFYKCDYYRKCSECVEVCFWCDQEIKCISKQSITSCPVKQNITQCPSLRNITNYLPRSVPTTVVLMSQNVNPNLTYLCVVTTGSEAVFSAQVNGNNITCNNVSITAGDKAKNSYPISVKYGLSSQSSTMVEMDDFNNNKVTVYNCSLLGKDCSRCTALKSVYECKWCQNNCQHKTTCGTTSVTCPPTNITELIPDNGPCNGGTTVTLKGRDLGITRDHIQEVKFGGVKCILSGIEDINDDFESDAPSQIVCRTGKQEACNCSSDVDKPDGVQLNIIGSGWANSTSVSFYYKCPSIKNIIPGKGPLAGGTLIAFTGTNLGVGNQDVKIIYNDYPPESGKVYPDVPQNVSWNSRKPVNYTIDFVTKPKSQNNREFIIKLLMDGKTDDPYVFNDLEFEYLPNPEIYPEKLDQTKGIISGGIGITITGRYLDSAQRGWLDGTHNGIELKSKCEIKSNTSVVCEGPKAPKNIKDAIQSETGQRRKRSTCDTDRCVVTVYVHLDGVSLPFKIEFFQDPTINNFTEVLLYGTRDQHLTIHGKNINLVAKESDISITIGIDQCRILKLENDYLTCLPPQDQPQSVGNSNNPEVVVRIGNMKFDIGYIQYKKEVEMIAIIAGSVGGGVLAILVIGFVIAIVKYRKMGKKAREYQKNLSDMEMEIRRVAREEFLDMHTTMSSVNRNLVEQGFPYHSYQQYACNVMFSVDYLWTEPVVSNGKMTDDERIKANKGMEMMESLFYNKFFMVSVISTMEKQKRFFIREKANLAGNLCAVLMGKMDYLEEILKMLLSNLVQETPSKKQKSLFRRCESITEKLLSNWLSLCLYPHIRANSGSPLYLLYIATQKTMESGPIDAILGDAKYTLYEEKLLKKWSSTEEGKQDLKFEAKTLTLNVVVDNGETIYKCKVLDCDTISQVKSKCMAQIYVNYPASQLNVDPHDLDLEWHEGFGGALRLKDEDNTSKRDGPLVRLNTLAHYNVKDESNMALVDPHGAENKEEDYVNLTNVNADNACDGSLDSSEPLHPRDGQNPGALQHWHLVKKEEETSKQGKSAIAELYLNRLFTTKQCLMEYISTLFNIVLEKDRCPPPTKCLFDFLDDLGDRHKIDAETLYTWKSHSYAIRVWASLIKMPSLLFDVNIPNYVEENLDVISQVFIESFSLSSQKFTKDSPSQKLIFHNEMILYRDRVKEFYKNVKVDSQTQDEYRQYMTEVNKQQQQTNFNKVSALYRLYKQLKPYFEEILEDLATCKETSNLRLDKKLEEVMDIMDDEDK